MKRLNCLHRPLAAPPTMNTLSRRFSLAALLAAGLWLAPAAQAADAPANCPATLQHSFPRLQDEKPQDLCQYAGRVVLVVNTASLCGFTGQYEGLEALYRQYGSRGLVVLGFPSNDFGQQEPGSGKEIADFCENTFGVKFAMFAKSSVAPGPGRPVNPLFAALAQKTGSAPKWNFHKYLIGRDGRTVKAYGSRTAPDDKALVAAIEAALAAPATPAKAAR
mgnify:CR=1 FL=1